MQTIISPIPDPVFFHPFFHNTQKTAFLILKRPTVSKAAFTDRYDVFFNCEEEHWELCQWFADDYQSELLAIRKASFRNSNNILICIILSVRH